VIDPGHLLDDEPHELAWQQAQRRESGRAGGQRVEVLEVGVRRVDEQQGLDLCHERQRAMDVRREAPRLCEARGLTQHELATVTASNDIGLALGIVVRKDVAHELVHDARVLLHARERQGRRTRSKRGDAGADVRAVRQQQPHNLESAVPGRERQGRVAAGVALGVDVGTSIEQLPDCSDLAGLAGVHQCREASTIAPFEVDRLCRSLRRRVSCLLSVREQELDDGHVASGSRQVQRIWLVRQTLERGVGIEQAAHDVAVAAVARNIERRARILTPHVKRGTSTQQLAHEVAVVLERRKIQRRVLVLVDGVDVGLALEQETHDLERAGVRRLVQRLVAVQAHRVVDARQAAIEQLAHFINVIPPNGEL